MSSFEFVSHDEFPEDKYIKEIVYMLVNGIRIAFVHKEMQTGGRYWDVMGSSVTVYGSEKKEVHKSVKFGDAFLMDDIKDYLKRRKWETKAYSTVSSAIQTPQTNGGAEDEQLPF